MAVTVESVLPDKRVLAHGVEGRRIIFLERDGSLGRVVMRTDVLEIPRCPIVAATAATCGPPGVLGSTKGFRERLVELLVADRHLLRAVHWPAWFDTNGTIRAEEAIGVVMLDDPSRPAPTPEQWAAVAVDLRLLERRVAQ